MSFYDSLLLLALVIALIVSWGNGRAWFWLGIIFASYVITSLYADLGGPSHPFFNAMADGICVGLVILAFRKRGLHNWEVVLGHVFLGMMAIDLFRLWYVISDAQYRGWLEFLNYAALLAIGGPRIIELVDTGLHSWGHRNSGIRRATVFLSSPWKGQQLFGHHRHS